MIIDCFDPTLYASASACIAALEEQGITLSRRLGARVYGLGRRGVRFSLALLDEAMSSGPALRLLQNAQWNDIDASRPDLIRVLLQESGSTLVIDRGICQIVCRDEVDEAAQAVAPVTATAVASPVVCGPTAAGPATGPATGSVLPMVLGSGEPLSFSGTLWSRSRMEEAALVLLDGVEEAKLVEAFRYLFRATLACGQAPTNLIITALRRGKEELSREVAGLVRDNIDREFGRALGDLISNEPSVINDAIHFFTAPQQERYLPILHTILIPTLIPLVERPDFRTTLLPCLPRLAPLISEAGKKSRPGPNTGLEALLDALLSGLGEMEMSSRFAVSAFLVALTQKCLYLTHYLVRRLQATLEPSAQAFYGNILSRVKISDEQREPVIQCMVELFVKHGGEAGMGRRLRATFKGLGKEGLRALSAPERLAQMNVAERMLTIHLWQDFREAKVPLPAQAVFVGMAMTVLGQGDEGALLVLIRSGQLARPELMAAILAAGDKGKAILSFLLDSAFRLEEPDDAVVLEVLKNIGFPILQHCFELVREGSALESGGRVSPLVVFGKLANRIAYGEAEVAKFDAMAEELLSYDYFERCKLPVVWEGLGEVGAAPVLSEERRAQFVERISRQPENMPEAKVTGLLAIYAKAHEQVRASIEGLLRHVVCFANPPRHLLQAALHGLRTLLATGPLPVACEQLVAELCRSVLAKSQDESLDDMLSAILEPDAQGDGVQLPKVWNKEDRDEALQILGLVACHSEAPAQLRRMVIFRLHSFLEDWLEGLEAGKNLYAFRDTPLWQIFDHCLEAFPEAVTLDLARQSALRLLEDYHKGLPGLELERRENAQRFLVRLLRVDNVDSIMVKGIPFTMRLAILNTLMSIAHNAPQENKFTEHLLRELMKDKILSPEMQLELEVRFGLDSCHCHRHEHEHNHECNNEPEHPE